MRSMTAVTKGRKNDKNNLYVESFNGIFSNDKCIFNFS